MLPPPQTWKLEQLDNWREIANGHYCLIILSVKHESVLYIDSLGLNNHLVSRIALEKYADTLKNVLKLPITEFRYVESKTQVLNDCGPLVCAYAEIAVNFSVESLFEDIDYSETFIRHLRLLHSNELDVVYFTPKISLQKIQGTLKNFLEENLLVHHS